MNDGRGSRPDQHGHLAARPEKDGLANNVGNDQRNQAVVVQADVKRFTNCDSAFGEIEPSPPDQPISVTALCASPDNRNSVTEDSPASENRGLEFMLISYRHEITVD